MIAIKMKKSILLTLNLIGLLCIGNITAQDMNKSQADQKAQMILNEYQADLELTIEQAPKFHQKISEYILKRSEIGSKTLAPEARKSALKQLSDQETSEMTGILNADQLALYKKLKPKVQPL